MAHKFVLAKYNLFDVFCAATKIGSDVAAAKKLEWN